MIQKSERLSAQRQLLELLGQRFKHHGFSPKPVGQSFWQKTPHAQGVFHISFIPHENDFDLTADVAVRIDEIKNLVNKHDSRRTPADKRRSMTFGGELGNISQGRLRRWTVDAVEDLPAIGEAVLDAFDSIGRPFLERHSNLASAHRLLTSERPEYVLLAPILGPRYMRAVASAHLLHETQELLEVVPRYEAKLREDNDLYLSDFISLCRGIGNVLL